MDIYVVQPGDTIFTVADKFNVPYERLVRDNNISSEYLINVGQILIITKPEQTYIVQNGDTLQSIAAAYEVTLLQLLQNNPNLFDRNYLSVGEELIIRYHKYDKQMEVNAFSFSHIREADLQKNLLFLTYLTIADYRVTVRGDIIEPEDDSIISMAKEYGVAPIMMLSTLTEQGRGSFGISHRIFNDIELQNETIQNLMQILREKQLYGVNFGFQYIIPEDLQNYVDFIARAKAVLSTEGFQVWVTLMPRTFGYNEDNNNENPYIFQVGQIADVVILLSYQWTVEYIPNVEQTTIPYIKRYTEYVLTKIPPEKILIGYTRIAYDWELPYVEGESPVAALANYEALRLANQIGTNLGFDEYYMTPYYYYERDGIEHFVWFKDARSLVALLNIAVEYNLKGISIWNVMEYTPQLSVTLNAQYLIPKLYGVTSDFLG
ncbi:MAG: Peptidoglycan-binding lysin domain protein [Herbinix sp.]|nr:Peptidoglycan-binding lysin domain protein [Herbinix sp.]